MAGTITATLTADTPLPHVQVDLSMDNVGTVASYTVTRDGGGQLVDIIKGAQGVQAQSYVDYAAPLRVPVVYRLAITRTDGTNELIVSTPPVYLDADGCYVTAPSTGRTMRVTLVSWPIRTSKARQSVLEVIGRTDPVVILDQSTTPSGQWRFYTRTDAETADLIALVLAQRVAILRPQPTASIAGVTVAVGDVDEQRFGDSGADTRRWIDVAIQEIKALPGTALPLPATLNGLSVLVPTTLYDLSQLRPTLAQLSQIETGP